MVSTNCKISILYPPIRSKEQVLRFEDFEVPPPRWPPLTKKREEKLYSMTLLTFSEARVIKLNLAEIGCGVLIPIPCTHNVSYHYFISTWIRKSTICRVWILFLAPYEISYGKMLAWNLFCNSMNTAARYKNSKKWFKIVKCNETLNWRSLFEFKCVLFGY